MAVERDAEDGGRYQVRVDPPPPGGSPANRLEQYETTVSRAAGAVLAATGRGDEVVLRISGRDLAPASGPEGRDRLLSRLAVTRLESP